MIGCALAFFVFGAPVAKIRQDACLFCVHGSVDDENVWNVTANQNGVCGAQITWVRNMYSLSVHSACAYVAQQNATKLCEACNPPPPPPPCCERPDRMFTCVPCGDDIGGGHNAWFAVPNANGACGAQISWMRDEFSPLTAPRVPRSDSSHRPQNARLASFHFHRHFRRTLPSRHQRLSCHRRYTVAAAVEHARNIRLCVQDPIKSGLSGSDDGSNEWDTTLWGISGRDHRRVHRLKSKIELIISARLRRRGNLCGALTTH